MMPAELRTWRDALCTWVYRIAVGRKEKEGDL